MSKDHLRPTVDRAVLGLGIVNPLTALPQLYHIFSTHNATGLSEVTIGAALLMSVVWTAYGFFGRQTVIWVSNAAWVAMNTATLAGVALFG